MAAQRCTSAHAAMRFSASKTRLTSRRRCSRKKDKLVVVDFFATWCGPCKTMGPRLETIVGGRATEVDLALVDVDQLDGLAAEFKVSVIPAIFALKNGKPVDQFVGQKDEDQLKAFIDGALKK
ncbi:thioredoxin 2 [Tyrophagus putrescentiae]|nr:thioredoxin 2 [Tyrophagus putrescentiae]